MVVPGVLGPASRWARRGVRALVLLAAAAGPARAHPIHTTLAELSYDPAARVLRVSLRVFADDFAAAVTRNGGTRARPVGAMPPDSAIFRYVTERFAVATARAGTVALRWCGTRRAGDVLFVCLRAAAVGSPAGARVRSTLLNEVFADQVNLVQASYDGRRQMLLFTPRDGVKALP